MKKKNVRVAQATQVKAPSSARVSTSTAAEERRAVALLKMESPIQRVQLDREVRKALEEKAEILRRVALRAKTDTREVFETASCDESEIASASEAVDSTSALSETVTRDLIQIEEALHRMESGTFGICEDCDIQIPSRRLMIVPEARLCLDCQMESERNHRGYHHRMGA